MPPYVNNKNCLAINYPYLINEWHFINKISPFDVTGGSSKKYWWKCKKGHEWQESCSARTRKKFNCPYCSNSRVCEDNCLATKAPNLINEWHPTKNGNLTPYNVVWGAHKYIWWICNRGHEWETLCHNRSFHGKGCPYCSNNKVCNDNCLATMFPELAKQWHPTKNNVTPYDVIAGSSKNFWWICEKGHEWQTTCDKRICGGRQKIGTNCPFCKESSGEKKIAEYFKNNKIVFERQVKFKDCKLKCLLSFDFKVNEVLIEYQGEQHYNLSYFGNKTMDKIKAEKNLSIIKIRDQIKADWCKGKGIKLVIIPYWDFKKIDQILDEVITSERF